jgi:hypothetical protein
VDYEGEIPEFLAAALRLPGVSVARPAPANEIDRFEEAIGIRLPTPHRALLVRANGILAAHGFERLLGVGDDPMALGPWNDADTWKFAWTVPPLEDYLCFAESGFGDQYAYRINELRRGVQQVHRLDRHLMEPAEQPVAPNLERFLRQFFARSQTPSQDVVDARAQVGDLALGEHAVHSPPPLVAGTQPTSLVRMPAASAMILQGDLATQLLDPANAERQIARLETYQDDHGRPRLRIEWA